MRDTCQFPGFWQCHWCFVTRPSAIWKRSCSSSSALGTSVRPTANTGGQSPCTHHPALLPLNTSSAISMPNPKIRGYSQSLIAWPRSWSRLKTWLKTQGLYSAQVTQSHVLKQLACRFGERLQQTDIFQSGFAQFPSISFFILEGEIVSAEEHQHQPKSLLCFRITNSLN